MDHKKNINSQTYWESRFREDWESFEGPRQSRFFALLAVTNLPQWLFEQIKQQSLTVVDWGCAQGDGTDILANYVDAGQLFGVDFSETAIEIASRRYPDIRFLAEDWIESKENDSASYDIVFSSNTLEHFQQPFSVLEILCSHAKKAVALALPYKETDRIAEHFYSFLPDNVPLELSNGYRLVWSRVANCTILPNTQWTGDQIFLIYANPAWLNSLKLTLSDCSISQEIDSGTTGFNHAITKLDSEINNLKHAVVERNQAISNLSQTIIERDTHITALSQTIANRDGHITLLDQSITERDSQISALNQTIAEQNGQVASLNQAISQRDSQLLRLNNELSEREIRISGLEQSVSDLNEQISALTQSLSDQGDLIAVLNKIRDERDGIISSLKNILNEREIEIYKIKTSTSWRITRPIRFIKLLLLAPKRSTVEFARFVFWRLPDSARHLLVTASSILRDVKPFLYRSLVNIKDFARCMLGHAISFPYKALVNTIGFARNAFRQASKAFSNAISKTKFFFTDPVGNSSDIFKRMFWGGPYTIRKIFNWIIVLPKHLQARNSSRALNALDIGWDEFDKYILSQRDKFKGVFIQEFVMDWNVPLYQRPQHIALAFSRLGYLVVYKVPSWTNENVDGYREVAKNVWLTNKSDVNNAPLRNAVWSFYSTSSALDFDLEMEKRSERGKVIYEYIDQIDPQISGSPEHIQNLLKLKDFAFAGGADFVVASARKLEAEAITAAGRKKVILAPNGVDTKHYRKSIHRFTRLPRNYLNFLKKHKKIVGYFGAIAPWLWYEKIAEIASARPDIGFVFIGPNYYVDGGIDKLSNADNILCLGPVDYKILPAYARQFDVCFIPFKPGEIAQTTSPLKLYEYFALEKPVVVTSDMLECVAFKEVFSGNTTHALLQAIDAAFQVKDDPRFKSRLAQLADDNNWESRVKAMEIAFDHSKQVDNPLHISASNRKFVSRKTRERFRKFAQTAFRNLPLSIEKKQKLRSIIRSSLGDGFSPLFTATPVTHNEHIEWIERANKAKKVVVIPCGFEFDGLVNQRPINAAKYFSDHGFFVIFVAWQWTPKDIMSKGCNEVWMNVFQVPLYTFVSEVEKLQHHNDFSLYLVTFPAPILVKLASSLRSRGFAIAYDIMDEWEAFSKVGQASWFSKSVEESLVLQADSVCGVSPPLKDKFSLLRSDISVIGNGYSPDVIGPKNRNIANASKGSERIIGYFGHLTDSWFDWGLVFGLALARPDITFEIIGYGEPEWATVKAANIPNIHILGKIPPEELHTHASRWSAGMIPFVEGVLAEAVDPIKIYEYLYFGLPTIVTGIRHLQGYPMTFFAEKNDILKAIDSALGCERNFEELDSFLHLSTWEARFDRLLNQVQNSNNIRLLYAN